MKMDIKIIPEDFNGLYYVEWEDFLSPEFKTDWDYLSKRPFELNCYITNRNNDTLGFYGPQSSQQQLAYFRIIDKSDSIVNFNFKIGINPFSSFLYNQSEKYVTEFNKINNKQIFFEPIQLKVSSKFEKKKIELIRVKN